MYTIQTSQKAQAKVDTFKYIYTVFLTLSLTLVCEETIMYCVFFSLTW